MNVVGQILWQGSEDAHCNSFRKPSPIQSNLPFDSSDSHLSLRKFQAVDGHFGYSSQCCWFKLEIRLPQLLTQVGKLDGRRAGHSDFHWKGRHRRSAIVSYLFPPPVTAPVL